MSDVKNITELLDAIDECTGRDEDLSLADVMDAVGYRSFGPFLLLAGLVIATPGVGDIPGISTATGIFVLLVVWQMIARKSLWLPAWLLNVRISDETVRKSVERLRAPARFVDRLLRPRLEALTYGKGKYGIALACVAIALATPAMEIVPLAANAAGAAIAAYGLSLMAHDGLLALIAYLFTAAVAGAILMAAL